MIARGCVRVDEEIVSKAGTMVSEASRIEIDDPAQGYVSRAALINSINDTIEMVRTSLLQLSDEELKDDYPSMKFSKVVSNEYLLVHILKHLTYHLGQINYHRRLLEE